jgi:hypothetical protein
VNFLLDCLESDDPALRWAAMRHLRKAVGHAVVFDVNQPAGARAAAVDRLREQLAPATRPATRAIESP